MVFPILVPVQFFVDMWIMDLCRHLELLGAGHGSILASGWVILSLGGGSDDPVQITPWIPIVGLLGVIFTIGFTTQWARAHRFKLALRSNQLELSRVNKELSRTAKEHEAEQARTRIACEIYDELGRQLTKITMLIAEVRHQDQLPPAKGIDHLGRIASLSRQVNSTLNDIIWAVDPEHDSVRDLVIHARICTDRILENASLRAEKYFVHNGPDRPIDPATKRYVFLLLKEALNNSLAYASADSLQVTLETDPGHFHIQVKDNGVGFEPEFSMTEGNGIRLMKARCDALGANFNLITATGKGCTVQISGPLR